MRKLLVLLAAVLAFLIVAPSGVAFATPAPPVGRLESAQVNTFNNSVVLTGWAVDPSARTLPTTVSVTVDGASNGGWQPAAVQRADVNRSMSASGGHGFVRTITVPVGNHQVCVNTRLRSGAQVTSLGCVSFQGYPMATQADMLAVARSIDPQHTINWVWKALPSDTSGLAEPWNRLIDVGSGHTVHNLRAVMLHEWSHVLQYRAFAGTDPWYDAIQAFNALLGHPADRQNYDGIEHGADCIALALGASYLGYGCPAALKTFGARIAHGVLMNKLQGSASVTVSGSTVTVTGWTLDPTAPTTANTYRVTDNGVPVTGWAATTVLRTDVNAATGVTGSHGFAAKVSLAKGYHRVCVSGRFVQTDKTAATIGTCTTVATA